MVVPNTDSSDFIDVALASDQHFFPYTAVTINSILKNYKAKNNIRIFILVDDFPNREFMENFDVLQSNCSRSEIKFIRASAGAFTSVKTTPGISKATFYRLNMHKLLPDDSKRIVYTDSDVIFLTCISELFHFDLKGNLFGGVEDSISKIYNKKFGIAAGNPHINAGVLLVDLDQMRSIPFTEICAAFIDKHKDRIELGDQQIINEVFNEKITYLPIRWNVHGSMFSCGWLRSAVGTRNSMSFKEASEAVKQPYAIHYTYNRKPWASLNHRHATKWFNYVEGSGFDDEIARLDLVEELNQTKNLSANKKAKLKHFIGNLLKFGRKNLGQLNFGERSLIVEKKLQSTSRLLSNQFHDKLFERAQSKEFSASLVYEKLTSGGKVLTNMRQVDYTGYNSNQRWLFCRNEVGQEYINNSDFVVFTIYRPNSEQFWKCVEQSSYYHLPTYFVEANFFTSFGAYFDPSLDQKYRKPIGFILDDIRYYFDSRGPSRIEFELNKEEFSLTEADLIRSRSLIRRIVADRITKYNAYVKETKKDFAPLERSVLVIDQKRNDMSVELGRSDDKSFEEMLNAAIEENPNRPVIFKWHPDNIHLNKSIQIKNKDRFIEIKDEISTIDLIETCEKVYTVSSQVGFESLLRGKNVIVFGQPFYSGWGLTDDRKKIPRRKIKRTVEEIFFLTCIRNSIYFDTKFGKVIPMEEALDNIMAMRKELSVKNFD